MTILKHGEPCPRNFLGVDVEQSFPRTNTAKAKLRDDMFRLFDIALRECGITPDLCDDFLDRGDGGIQFVRPVDEVPRTRILTTFFPTLSTLLSEHGVARPDRRFRMRAVMHSGDVHFDQRGTFGEDIDITCRLLNAPELKTKLRQIDEPLVLVVSDDIYWSVVRHGYDGIDRHAFQPLIKLQVGDRPYHGWVQVPAEARPVSSVVPLIDRVS